MRLQVHAGAVGKFAQIWSSSVPIHYERDLERAAGSTRTRRWRIHYAGSHFVKVMPLGDAAWKEAGLLERDAFLRPGEDRDTNMLEVVLGATSSRRAARLDNLGKAAMTVQNLNIALGLDEKTMASEPIALQASPDEACRRRCRPCPRRRERRPCRRRPCPRRCRRCSACRPRWSPNLGSRRPLQRASHRARRPPNGLPPGAPPPKGVAARRLLLGPAPGLGHFRRLELHHVVVHGAFAARRGRVRPCLPSRSAPTYASTSSAFSSMHTRRHAHTPQRRLALFDAIFDSSVGHFGLGVEICWRRRRFLRRRRLVGGDVDDVLVLRPPSRLGRIRCNDLYGVHIAGAGAGALFGTSSPFLNASRRFASSSFSKQSS